MQNPLLSFLVELFNRLRTKKPRFFIWLQWLTGAASAVTGLPTLLTSWGVHLSPAMSVMENKFVSACTLGALIASQLTSASPVIAVTKDGIPIKATDASKLPFTSEVEIKKAQDSMIPNSSSTLAETKK